MSFLRLLFTRLSNCLTIAEGRLLNALGLYPHSSKGMMFHILVQCNLFPLAVPFEICELLLLLGILISY